MNRHPFLDNGRRCGYVFLAMPKDLTAVYVSEQDVGDYRVREAGWYAFDERERAVLGPFESLAECERAIRERLKR